MRKPNTAKAIEPASDFRQRAARARDAAGRFTRRLVTASQEQPDVERLRNLCAEPRAADAPASTAASTIDFGPDAWIADLATEFCRAYQLNTIADQAVMAGNGSEAEWRRRYDAVSELMDRLETAEPKTMLGMALKCLAPIGLAAWEVGIDDDLAQMDVWHRVGAQFETAIIRGDLTPLPLALPDQLKAGQTDPELQHLGQQFDALVARQKPIREEHDRIEEAWAHTVPQRPDCLVFRESDQTFGLRRWGFFGVITPGTEIGWRDVDEMRGHVFVQGVTRPAMPEDRVPANALTVEESRLWPQAQARADEIIAAWDAWQEECDRHKVASGLKTVEELLDAVDEEIQVVADRIAALPAATAEGMRVKLRVSAWYVEEHETDCPAGKLLNSLLRDALGSRSPPVYAPHPDAALFALGAEFMAAWAAEDAKNDRTSYQACQRVARQIAKAPATSVEGYGIKALLLARFDSDCSGPSNPVASQGPVASHWNVLRQIQEGAARLAKINSTWGSAR